MIDDGEWLIACVGARRSGTHWLQRVLATHPAVESVPGETHLFSRGLRPLAERLRPSTPGSTTVGSVYLPADRRRALLRHVADEVLRPYLDNAPTGRLRLLERTPDHVHCIDLITELYPDAHVVHVVRDGREVVRSLVRQDWGPSEVRRAAEEWRDAVRAGREQGARARHYVEVRYEDLHRSPGDTVRRLLDSLGLAVTDAVVADAEAEALRRANTWGAARDDLGRRERRLVERIAGDLLTDAAPAPASPPDRPEAPHWSARSIHWAQLAVDRLLEAVHTGADDLGDLLSPTACLRLVDHGGEHPHRGAAAGPAWLAQVQADPATRGTVARSDVHPTRSLVTVVLTYRLDAGGTVDRLVVVRLGDHGIEEAVWYRLPLLGTSS